MLPNHPSGMGTPGTAARGMDTPGTAARGMDARGMDIRGVDGGRQDRAAVFAALGDETRLALVARLCLGRSYSISKLTEGSDLTRQAITKHLRVLENVGLVRSVRAGRESLYEFDREPLEEIREYLDLVSEQWDNALSRLKSFVEE